MNLLHPHAIGRKEGNVLFNDALNTFYLRLYGVKHMVNDIQIAREKTRCRHMCYYFRLAARVLVYALSHRQDSTFHGLCYTSRGALAGTITHTIDIEFLESVMRSTWESVDLSSHTVKTMVLDFVFLFVQNVCQSNPYLLSSPRP